MNKDNVERLVAAAADLVADGEESRRRGRERLAGRCFKEADRILEDVPFDRFMETLQTDSKGAANE